MPLYYWNFGARTQATFRAEPQPVNTTSSIPSLSDLRLPAFSATSRIVPSQALVWLIISNSAFLPRLITVNSFPFKKFGFQEAFNFLYPRYDTRTTHFRNCNCAAGIGKLGCRVQFPAV